MAKTQSQKPKRNAKAEPRKGKAVLGARVSKTAGRAGGAKTAGHAGGSKTAGRAGRAKTAGSSGGAKTAGRAGGAKTAGRGGGTEISRPIVPQPEQKGQRVLTGWQLKNLQRKQRRLERLQHPERERLGKQNHERKERRMKRQQKQWLQQQPLWMQQYQQWLKQTELPGGLGFKECYSEWLQQRQHQPPLPASEPEPPSLSERFGQRSVKQPERGFSRARMPAASEQAAAIERRSFQRQEAAVGIATVRRRIAKLKKTLGPNEMTTPLSQLPKDYKFVPKGDVYVTRNCRVNTVSAGQILYIVYSDQTGDRIGVGCPPDVASQVRSAAAETSETRLAAVASTDARIRERAQAILKATFPNMPADARNKTADHAFKKYSGRVGRRHGMDNSLKASLAVRAYIRHELTDYEKLLKEGVTRETARVSVEPKVQSIYNDFCEKRKYHLP